MGAAAQPMERPDHEPGAEPRETPAEGAQERRPPARTPRQNETIRDFAQRARARVENAKAELEHIDKREWEQVTGRQASELEDLDARLGEAAAILDEQSSTSPGPDQQAGQALALADTASAALNDAEKMASAADSAAPSTPLAKAVNRILELIEKAAQWIFSLIMRLTNPKEWTLETQARLLGIGKVGITITFG
jgi:hypothetical protein